MDFSLSVPFGCGWTRGLSNLLLHTLLLLPDQLLPGLYSLTQLFKLPPPMCLRLFMGQNCLHCKSDSISCMGQGEGCCQEDAMCTGIRYSSISLEIRGYCWESTLLPSSSSCSRSSASAPSHSRIACMGQSDVRLRWLHQHCYGDGRLLPGLYPIARLFELLPPMCLSSLCSTTACIAGQIFSA